MARYLYSELSSALTAWKHCTSNSAHISQKQFADQHEARLLDLVREHMPSGSGFDSGTHLDFDASHAEKLVFTTSFHHMNSVGYYDGWTEHTVTVTPSFQGFNLRISGRNRNDIKEYIHDTFASALKTEV
jgi:hypothetical protein